MYFVPTEEVKQRLEMMVLYLISIPLIHTMLPLERHTQPTRKDSLDVKLTKHEYYLGLPDSQSITPPLFRQKR